MATSAVCPAPIYHSSSNKVLKVKQNLEQEFKVQKAIQEVQDVYQDAMKMIHAQYNLGQTSPGIPLCVTLQLIDLLSMDQIQYEDKLKYEIAKASRVFMDLTFISAVISDRNIYPDTHKQIGEKLKKVMETLPSKEVRTDYELRCCWATTLVLNDAKMYLKQFVIHHIGDTVKAIATLSPGSLAGAVKKVIKDLYDQIDTSWFTTVLPLHLQNQAALANFQLNDIFNLADYYKENRESLKKYQNTEEVAFSVLEFLIEVMDEAIKKNNEDLQLKVLSGGDDHQKEPGLADFVNFGLDGNLRTVKTKLSPSWKVRCRVIDFLFQISFHEKVQEKKAWNLSLEFIAMKFEHKENKHVCRIIQQHLLNLKENIDKKLSPTERVEFLREKLNGKADKVKLGKEVSKVTSELNDKLQQWREKEDRLKQQINQPPQEQVAGNENDNLAQRQLELDVEKLQEEIEDQQIDLENLHMQEALANI